MLDMDPIKAGHGLQQKKKENKRGKCNPFPRNDRVAICNGFWFDPILLFSI